MSNNELVLLRRIEELETQIKRLPQQFRNYVNLLETTTPSTPPSGQVSLYAKDGGLPFVKNDAGVESPIALGGVWQDWTPVWTGSGSMTVTVTTLTIASYCRVGNLMQFILRADVTLGGTTSTSIFATLPQNSLDNFILTFTAQTNKPNPFTVCSAFLSGAGTQVEIRQNGSTNWTLESGVRVFVQGFIRI